MEKNSVVVVDVNSLYPNVICSHNISPDTLVAFINNVNIEDKKEYLKNLLLIETKIQENFFKRFAVNRHAGRIFGILYFANELEAIRNYNWQITTYNEQLNLTGEQLIELIKKKNLIVTANGCLFSSTNIGIFPKIEKNLLREKDKFGEMKSNKDLPEQIRKEADIKQKSVKTIANALYGVFGTSGFDFYNVYLAEAITITGQIISFILTNYVNNLIEGKDLIEVNINAIQNGKNELNEKQKYVLYRDTDSIFIHIPKNIDIDFVKKINDAGPIILQQAGLKFVKNKNLDNFLEHSPKVKLEFKGDAALFTDVKKRYFVYDSATDKAKITGFINVANSNIENEFMKIILKDIVTGVLTKENKNLYIQNMVATIQEKIKDELLDLIDQIKEDKEHIDSELVGVRKINVDLKYETIYDLFNAFNNLNELEKQIKSTNAIARSIMIYNSLTDSTKLTKGMKAYLVKGGLNTQAINELLKRIDGTKKILVSKFVAIKEIYIAVDNIEFLSKYVNLNELQKKVADKICKNLITNVIDKIL